MSLARNIGDLPNGDDAPVFACRAWVNFNGTDTIAIRDSGNVSSITDNGTGDYTVTFTTAMPDANYCTLVTPQAMAGATSTATLDVGTPLTTTSVTLLTMNVSGNTTDTSEVCVAVVR